MELQGCGTALVTPFTATGAVDEAALRRHVQWQIESGIGLLIPCGTTGEASTLSDEEWLRVVTITVEEAAGRALVFAGCTHNATAQTVTRAQQLAALRTTDGRGVDGILVANPYYNKPGQQGQYLHFRAVAEAVAPLPVMLYNIPGRTAANLEPATTVRLAHDCPNITAIKESSGNLFQITELLTTAPASLRVFAGDDGLALPIMALGGVGLISVASNVIPREMATMIDAANTCDWPTARKFNAEWFRLMQAHFWEASPAPVKAVLQMLGRGEDVLRLPMVPVSDATRAKLQALIAELKLAS